MGSCSLTRDWTQAPCVGGSLSPWATREVPWVTFGLCPSRLCAYLLPCWPRHWGEHMDGTLSFAWFESLSQWQGDSKVTGSKTSGWKNRFCSWKVWCYFFPWVLSSTPTFFLLYICSQFVWEEKYGSWIKLLVLKQGISLNHSYSSYILKTNLCWNQILEGS